MINRTRYCIFIRKHQGQVLTKRVTAEVGGFIQNFLGSEWDEGNSPARTSASHKINFV